MKKKNQTVTATEENVFGFVKRVCMMADAFKQMGGKMNFDSAMDKLNYQFGDSLGEELMVKASKALEEHGIVDTEQEVKKEDEQEVKEEVMEKKQAKWVLSKAKKIDAFEQMCEKEWADSGLQDEHIKNKVHNILAQWYRLDSPSPLAGYSKRHRPQSQEELEKQMCEDFAMQFSQYGGYRDEQDIEQIVRQQDMEQIVRDENLKKAEWEYFEDETDYSPYAEATATIDGKTVKVGYLWDEQVGGCYVHVNGADVRDRGVCEHCCEVVQKAIGKELTGLSYGLWESWVEYHGLHEGWEDMDDDERHDLYNKSIVCC